VWEDFGEAMENDFRLASRKLGQTVRRLWKGKQDLAQAVLSFGGELLTQTEYIRGRCKEHFEEFLNQTSTSSEDLGEAPPKPLAEVAEVVRKLFSGKEPGVDEIRPELLKTPDIVGLTRLFSVVWRSGTVPVEWQTGVVVNIFKKGDRRVCSNYQGITLLSLPGNVPRCWKGGSSRLSNLRFRRNNVDSVLAVEQWTSSLPLQCCWGGQGSLPIQSTCALWTWRRLMTMSPGESCGG